MRAALTADDRVALRRAAHTLKSTSASLGATGARGDVPRARGRRVRRRTGRAGDARRRGGAPLRRGPRGPAGAPERERPRRERGRCGRVLVVDDTRRQPAASSIRALEQQGHSALEAADGRAALELLGSEERPRCRRGPARPGDARDGRLRDAAAHQGRRGAAPYAGHRHLGRGRARQRRALHRDGRDGLPAQALQRGDPAGPAVARRWPPSGCTTWSWRTPPARPSCSRRSSARRTELARFLSPQVAALVSSPEGQALLAGHRRADHGRLLRPARLHGLLRDGRARGAARTCCASTRPRWAS